MAEIINETSTSHLTLGKVVRAAIRRSVHSYFFPIILALRLSRQLYQWITFQAEYPKRESQKYYILDELQDIEDELYELIFRQAGAEAGGMVIVAGRTASAKRHIPLRLIKRYLQEQSLHFSRVPHLVTFEDPVEKYFYSALGEPFVKYETPEGITEQQPIDYIPRQKGSDVNSLKQALNEVLQQTPIVLFVGETRNIADWEQLMRFAGTGRLVVTTMNAGSLSEAMSTILRATGAQDPKSRSIIADRLLALIHLRRMEVEDNAILIPALWRRTPCGTKALIAEGLASLIPNPDPQSDQPVTSTFGRYWFVQRLLERAERKDDRLAEQIKRRALEWDLEGS